MEAVSAIESKCLNNFAVQSSCKFMNYASNSQRCSNQAWSSTGKRFCAASTLERSFYLSKSVFLQESGLRSSDETTRYGGPSSILPSQKGAYKKERRRKLGVTCRFTKSEEQQPVSAAEKWMTSWLVPRNPSPAKKGQTREDVTAELEVIAESLRALSADRELEELEETGGAKSLRPGVEMRSRVHRLLDRVLLLQQQAKNIPDGGRVPVQITATLKALERERNSLENIIHLANKARPDTSYELMERFQKKLGSIEAVTRTPGKIFDAVKEKEEGVRQYKMTAAAGQSSSPLAIFKEEIERRVMEQVRQQLKGKVKSMEQALSSNSVTSSSPAASMADALTEIPLSSTNGSGTGNGDASSTNGNGVANSTGNDRGSGFWQSTFARGVRAAEQTASPVTNFDSVPPFWPVPTKTSGDSQGLQFAEAKVRQDLELPLELQRRLKKAEEEPLIGGTSAMDAAMNEVGAEKVAEALQLARKEIEDLRLRGDSRLAAAEERMQELEKELARRIPMDKHEEIVRSVREPLAVARAKVAALAGQVQEKEALLEAVRSELLQEREQLLARVSSLNGEVARRVSMEDLDAAVMQATAEVERELRSAQERVAMLTVELERKEMTIETLARQWGQEKEALKAEISAMRTRINSQDRERLGQQSQLRASQARAKVLEAEIRKMAKDQSGRSSVGGVVDDRGSLLARIAELEVEVQRGLETFALEQAKLREELEGRASLAETALEAEKEKAAVLQQRLSEVTTRLKEAELRAARAESDAWEFRFVIDRVVRDLDRLQRAAEAANLNRLGKRIAKTVARATTALVRHGPLPEDPTTPECQPLPEIGYYCGAALKDSEQMARQRRQVVATWDAEDDDEDDDAEWVIFDEELLRLDYETLRARTAAVGEKAVPEEEPAVPAPAPAAVTEEPEEPLEPPPPPPPSITLLYKTTWDTAYLHFAADKSNKWTQLPGKQMVDAHSELGENQKTLTIQASTMEFVITDGNKLWDRCPNGNNYIIEEEGTFLLQDGSITKIR